MSRSDSEMEPQKTGFVALVGLPNAGKSTLLNQVLGQKVSITSSKPQTTRNRVVGIHTDEHIQAILVDTPGLCRPRSTLHKAMRHSITRALGEVDCICWVVDLGPVSRKLDAGMEVFGGGLGAVAQLLAEHSACGLTVALNKVDILDKPRVLPVLEAFYGRYPEAPLIPISARTGDGVDALSAAWARQLPEGPALFPTDQLMDCSESFVVSEIIREKIFRLTGQEIPYSTAVEVEAFEEIHRDGPNPRVRIHARIIVERSSQKGIIIGKRGSMLKQIGTLARKDIQALLGAGVHLELHVAVEEKWSRNPRLLRDLGIE